VSSSETRLGAPPPEAVAAGPRLGTLRRVDARQVLGEAAGDLVPWLRSNPELVGEALRLDIRPGATEFPEAIGELAPGLPVVVRAPSGELTDRDVRSLAGIVAEVDAGIFVLLAAEIADEFRERLDKLNRNTAKVMVFYGVEFELWQIDDSLPAPLFRVVVGPEGWDKRPRSSPPGMTSAVATDPGAGGRESTLPGGAAAPEG
jgi:hypothetical protein